MHYFPLYPTPITLLAIESLVKEVLNSASVNCKFYHHVIMGLINYDLKHCLCSLLQLGGVGYNYYTNLWYEDASIDSVSPRRFMLACAERLHNIQGAA